MHERNSLKYSLIVKFPDSERVHTRNSNHSERVHERNFVQVNECHEGAVRCVSLMDEGDGGIFTGGDDGAVRLWTMALQKFFSLQKDGFASEWLLGAPVMHLTVQGLRAAQVCVHESVGVQCHDFTVCRKMGSPLAGCVVHIRYVAVRELRAAQVCVNIYSRASSRKFCFCKKMDSHCMAVVCVCKVCDCARAESCSDVR